jgi:DNA-binding NarL/FixJ family response regulator
MVKREWLAPEKFVNNGNLFALFDLTPAQLKVAPGLAEGLSDREIADGLRRPEDWVNSRVRDIMPRTGVTNRDRELAGLALRWASTVVGLTLREQELESRATGRRY